MKLGKLEKKFVNSHWQTQKNIKIAQQLFGKIDSSDVKKVLEVGCGIGTLSSYLAKNYDWEITGIDLDPEQIEIARREYVDERLKFFEADVTELTFEKDQFDMVLSFDVLHHILCWDRAIEEIGRVLKSKGYYILNDLAFSRSAANIFLGLLKSCMGVYTADGIIDCLTRNDFIIVYKGSPDIIFPMRHHNIVSQKI